MADVAVISAQRRWAIKNKVQSYRINRRARIKRRFGITDTEYDDIVGAAAKCGCCDKTFTTKKNLDHCHTTGKIRGVLCNKCNVGIGALGDSVEGVEKALRYLCG